MANDIETLETTQPYKSPFRIVGDARSALTTFNPEDIALKPLEDAVGLLAQYVGLGSVEDITKAFRAATILDTHITSLPKPVQEAWLKHLRSEGAL